MHKEYRIERKQLYELVWSKPMTEVAKEYSVSDKAIAKICDKLNVPVPGVGHWRKIEVGEEPIKNKHLDIPIITFSTETSLLDLYNPLRCETFEILLF